MTTVQVEKIKVQTLTWLKTIRFKKIIDSVEFDYLLMVSTGNKGVDYVSPIGVVIQDCIRLLKDIPECSLVFYLCS